nr:thyroid receptor interacting protein 11 [Hymenolepis microstoma]
MSWLESLKSSTAARLVSEAAKEIFTESTAEIEDPVANLKNSQIRINELENLVCQFKSEIHNYQKEIADLNLCIENLELRVVHNQEESDSRLREKEKRICELLEQIKCQREEPEGECVPVKYLQSSNSFLLNPNDSSNGNMVNIGISHHLTDDSEENLLRAELSRRYEEIEELRKELEQSREEKYQEVAALQESNTARLARLQERLRCLEEIQASKRGTSQDLPSLDSPTLSDATVQTEILPAAASILLVDAVIQTDKISTEVSDFDRKEADSKFISKEDEEYAEMESKMARFERISKALSSAVSLLPPPPSEPSVGPMVWPPQQPEAQVAVLVAAEAASRQELMLARDYITQMLSHSDELSHLLLETLTTYTKFHHGECTLSDFEQAVKPLIERDESYAELIERLKVSPLEKCLNEICSQLETNGRLTKNIEDFNEPRVEQLFKLLSREKDPLREFLLTGRGRVDSEDQKIVDRFNFLIKESEYKKSLCDSLLRLLENYTIELNMDNLDSDSIIIVKQVADALSTKNKTLNMVKDETVENIRNRLKVVDVAILSPEVRSAFELINSLYHFIDNGDNADPNLTTAADLLKILSLHISDGMIPQTDSDYKLRDCLKGLMMNSNCPDLISLCPDDQVLVSRLVEKINREPTHSTDLAALVNLLKCFTEEIQANRLEELQQRIKSSQLDEEVTQHLENIAVDYTKLWAMYTQAEKDKVALGQLVRSKHEESKAYHAQLQKLLAERQSTGAIRSEEAARLQAKIERLESHLLQAEENHTQEAVLAEEREASLRENLARTEAEVGVLKEFVETAEERIECAREERDAAKEAARVCQNELSALRINHNNLLKALDSLEKEQQAESNATAQHFRTENERLQKEIAELRQKISELKTEVSRLGILEDNNRSLQEQLGRHADRLSEAHALARRYEERIQVLKNELKEKTIELNGKLDKSVLKNLLISCMKLPPSKRPDAFRSLGSVLNFTTEDYNMLGFNEPVATNWKELFWPPGTSSNRENSKSEHSFVEMLANFLEKESNPPTQIRLPTDYLRANSTSGDMKPGTEFAPDVQMERVHSMSSVQHRQHEQSVIVPASVPQRKPSPSKNPLLSGLSSIKPPPDML